MLKFNTLYVHTDYFVVYVDHDDDDEIDVRLAHLMQLL